MNLTCGRNPWKRASIEDSTFRAYLKNPKFLSTILPLSSELDAILRRIFECDPRRRISISELRDLVVRCPQFTTRTAAAPPPSPPPEEQHLREMPFKGAQGSVASWTPRFTAPYTPSPSPPLPTDRYHSHTTSRNGSVPASDGSSLIEDSSLAGKPLDDPYRIEIRPGKLAYVPRQTPNNSYGGYFSLDSVPKSLVHKPFTQPVRVC